MKKTILFAALLLGTSLTFAQVTRGTIGTGTYINWDGQELTDSYGLDFDNDGYLDVRMAGDYDYNQNECVRGYVEYAWDKIKIVLPSSGDYWDVFALLPANTTIDASSNWGGEGDGMIEDYNNVSTTADYVGFQILKGSSYHYGYAKIHREGNTIYWDECYYNATPNAAINAGQTAGGGTQGISEVKPVQPTPQVRKIMYRNRIYIERDGILYDLSGRKATL